MYDYTAWGKFVFVLNYLGVCLKLPDVLVNLGKISTEWILIGNLQCLAFVLTPAFSIEKGVNDQNQSLLDSLLLWTLFGKPY